MMWLLAGLGIAALAIIIVVLRIDHIVAWWEGRGEADDE